MSPAIVIKFLGFDVFAVFLSAVACNLDVVLFSRVSLSKLFQGDCIGGYL